MCWLFWTGTRVFNSKLNQSVGLFYDLIFNSNDGPHSQSSGLCIRIDILERWCFCFLTKCQSWIILIFPKDIRECHCLFSSLFFSDTVWWDCFLPELLHWADSYSLFHTWQMVRDLSTKSKIRGGSR